MRLREKYMEKPWKQRAKRGKEIQQILLIWSDHLSTIPSRLIEFANKARQKRNRDYSASNLPAPPAPNTNLKKQT
jgi:hypothetical protein